MKALDREAMQLAEMVRRQTGCECIPTDVRLMAERLGIRVFCRHLPSRIFAASELWHRIVVLNRRRSPLQQRYDLAHEIAEQITLDMGNSHGAWQNQFAGHLLVPLDCLRGQILKGADLDRLCQRFDTSESVVFYQMAFLKDGILLSQADENIRGSVVRSDQAAIGSMVSLQYEDPGRADPRR